MKLTDSERLILIMLAEIKQGLKLQGGVDAEFVQAALSYGYDWAFDIETSGIHNGMEGEPKPQNVQEVMDILEMWSRLEEDYKELTDEDKVLVKEVTYGQDVWFPGFDGNSLEGELTIANFITHYLPRWDHFKGREISDSHRSVMNQYRRMLTAYQQVPGNSSPLTAQRIIDTLLEQVHPSHR